MGQKTESQGFLASEVQQAMQSGDEAAVKLVYLHYQQAMLKTLQEFEPCEEKCSHIDLTLLKKRVEKLSAQTERYIATVNVLPMQQIQELMKGSRTTFRDVAALCDSCRESIQKMILENFKIVRQQK